MLFKLCEKSVGTTELHYSTKKRYHVLNILSMVKTWYRFFVFKLYSIAIGFQCTWISGFHVVDSGSSWVSVSSSHFLIPTLSIFIFCQ